MGTWLLRKAKAQATADFPVDHDGGTQLRHLFNQSRVLRGQSLKRQPHLACAERKEERYRVCLAVP
jgi:hypothetical protein